MHATPAAITEFTELLAETPGRIARACVGVAPSLLSTRPDIQSWSVNDNLAHLRACADVWGESIAGMLRVDGGTQRKISPRAHIRKSDYPELDFAESLAAFTAQRAVLLDRLRALDPSGWERGAMIDGRRHTVFSQVRRMALHEQTHCEQIEATLALLLL